MKNNNNNNNNQITGKLSPLVGHTDSFINDSYDFVKLIKDEKVDNDDLIISSDVVSLFTKIPLKDVIQVLYEVTDVETV